MRDAVACDITTPVHFPTIPADLKTSQRFEKEKKKIYICEYAAFFSFFSKASQETGRQNQQPSPRMQGAGLITTDGFLKQTCSLSLYLSLSLTLSCLRGVVQSVTLERYLFLPFLAGFRDPSSEKLTGPVQFPVSSPLSRLNCCELVRK